MTWSPDIVIYHHPCADGFGAAWAIHQRWPDAQYLPAGYDDAPPDVRGKHVLIVDFSYKAPVLEAMADDALTVVVLDHHKTAEADLAEWRGTGDMDGFRTFIDECMPPHPAFPMIHTYFDMNRSGARLAWEFAHPGSDVPRLIRLIEDRDLWRFKLPGSKPFNLLLRAIPQTFDAWSSLHYRLEDNHPDMVLAEAYAMQAYHDSVVRLLADTAITGKRIREYTPPIVNCPGLFASDVGHELLQRHPLAVPFALTWHAEETIEGTIVKLSLRSDDARTDVSEIAKTFGGGGHRNAAGFTLTMEEWIAL